jgi:hypothetical protein
VNDTTPQTVNRFSCAAPRLTVNGPEAIPADSAAVPFSNTRRLMSKRPPFRTSTSFIHDLRGDRLAAISTKS